MIPPSTARLTIGSASASSSAHSRLSCLPKLIIPRQTRETRRPVSPRFTYSIPSSLRRWTFVTLVVGGHAVGPQLRLHRLGSEALLNPVALGQIVPPAQQLHVLGGER